MAHRLDPVPAHGGLERPAGLGSAPGHGCRLRGLKRRRGPLLAGSTLALMVAVALPATTALSLAMPVRAGSATPEPLPGGAPRWAPGWDATAFWQGRTWSWGWYRVRPELWSWWPQATARWGGTALADAAALTAAVNGALAARNPQLLVPGSALQLDYTAVQLQRPMGVRYRWTTADGSVHNAAADCQSGLVEGLPPETPAEAQLLNAACQVTYGSPSP